MTFNDEQLTTLSQWEEHFRTAVRAQWARNPGSAALKVIWQTYTSTTGDTRRFNDNCNHCILSLLQDCGRIYFRDKEELARRQEAKKAVDVSGQAVKPVRKKRIATKKAQD